MEADPLSRDPYPPALNPIVLPNSFHIPAVKASQSNRHSSCLHSTGNSRNNCRVSCQGKDCLLTTPIQFQKRVRSDHIQSNCDQSHRWIWGTATVWDGSQKTQRPPKKYGNDTRKAVVACYGIVAHSRSNVTGDTITLAPRSNVSGSTTKELVDCRAQISAAEIHVQNKTPSIVGDTVDGLVYLALFEYGNTNDVVSTGSFQN